MGINEDIGRAADEIIDRVTDAVKNGNYAHLSSDIGQAVKRNQQIISEKMRDAGRPHAAQPQQGQRRPTGQGYNPYAAGASRQNSMQQMKDEKEHRTAFMRKVPAGGSLAATSTVFTIFTGINCIIAVIFGILAIVTASIGARLTCIVMIVGLCIFGGMGLIFSHFMRGAKKDQARNALFQKYQQIIGTKEYFSIEDLMIATGQPHEQVISDLKSMMDSGMLPGATMDPKETTLMLSDYARGQYRALMQNTAAQQAADKDLPQDAIELLKQGDEYIARVHRANDLIPEEGMSAKLSDLEVIMKKIFAEVRRSPEKRNDLRRLMDYYLPTTLKLIEAYVDLETKPDTENIASMKREIEGSLDVINEACRKIFDAMFEDENWDITSDINVMKSMMKQDGLVDDDTLKTGN